MAPKTPMGVSFMTRSVYLNMVCATPSKKARTGLPASPARVRPMPKRAANTTTGRMSPSAAALMTLLGKAEGEPEEDRRGAGAVPGGAWLHGVRWCCYARGAGGVYGERR